MQANIYLCFNGNTEEAMNHYANVLDGKILHVARMSEAPMPMKEGDKDKILHAAMQLADVTMMFSDSNDENRVTFGDSISISLNCKSVGEVDKAFAGLSEGGVTKLPPQDMFWGAYFAMCTDKFGINWMFNYDKPKD